MPFSQVTIFLLSNSPCASQNPANFSLQNSLSDFVTLSVLFLSCFSYSWPFSLMFCLFPYIHSHGLNLEKSSVCLLRRCTAGNFVACVPVMLFRQYTQSYTRSALEDNASLSDTLKHALRRPNSSKMVRVSQSRRPASATASSLIRLGLHSGACWDISAPALMP